jgi:hypothetical protein
VTDRELVEVVANAKIGDTLPTPYQWHTIQGQAVIDVARQHVRSWAYLCCTIDRRVA